MLKINSQAQRRTGDNRYRTAKHQTLTDSRLLGKECPRALFSKEVGTRHDLSINTASQYRKNILGDDQVADHCFGSFQIEKTHFIVLTLRKSSGNQEI